MVVPYRITPINPKDSMDSKTHVTSEIMAEIDYRAQTEYGISQDFLMESAGEAVAVNILKDCKDIEKHKIIILCGKGNNGGDGFVCARYLKEFGAENMTVYALDKGGIKEGSALKNFDIALKKGIKINDIKAFSKQDYEADILIDALFGTGFKGELPYIVLNIIQNGHFSKIYAVDIPSGLDGTTGKVHSIGFSCYKTITFGLPKCGFLFEDGPKMTGEVIVENIGLPKLLINQYL